MNKKVVFTFALLLIFLLTACTAKDAEPVQLSDPTQSAESQPGLYDQEVALSAFKEGGCGACHIIPGVPNATGTIGPDLTVFGLTAEKVITSPEYQGKAKTASDFIKESIIDPEKYLSTDCAGQPCQAGLMPATFGDQFDEISINAMVAFLADLKDASSLPAIQPTQTALEPAELTGSPTSNLTDEEFSWAKQTYFERCAGCHGTLRKGATGPALTTDCNRTQRHDCFIGHHFQWNHPWHA